MRVEQNVFVFRDIQPAVFDISVDRGTVPFMGPSGDDHSSHSAGGIRTKSPSVKTNSMHSLHFRFTLKIWYRITSVSNPIFITILNVLHKVHRKEACKRILISLFEMFKIVRGLTRNILLNSSQTHNIETDNDSNRHPVVSNDFANSGVAPRELKYLRHKNVCVKDRVVTQCSKACKH